MEVIATAAAGLLVWIVLWALGVSGFDAFIIGFICFIAAIAIQNVAPRLASHKDQ